MKKIISIILILLLTIPLIAGELGFYRIKKNAVIADLKPKLRTYLKNQSWRHSSQLLNVINEPDASYFYVTCSSKIEQHTKYNDIVALGYIQKMVTISVGRKGFNKNEQWQIRKSTIAKYREDYKVITSTP